MNQILDRYEQAIEEIQAQADRGGSYLDRFSQSNNIYDEIRKEQEQLDELRKIATDRAKVEAKIRKKEKGFIHDHPSFKTKEIDEIVQNNDHDVNKESVWKKFIKVNHEIYISVTIESVLPFIQEWGNIQNELTFDHLRFRLHHVDKTDTSKMLKYSLQHNLFHKSYLVDGKMLKSDKSIKLEIKHTIRNHNISLYQQLFKSQTIMLTAENAFGAVVGFSEFQIDDIDDFHKNVQNIFRVLVFRKKYQQGDTFIQGQKVFSAKSYINIESYAIAPEIKELAEFAKMQDKKRPHSRSPSSNRVVSVSPNDRSGSPKLKRKMVSNIVKGPTDTIRLSIIDDWQYSYSLQDLNLIFSRELVYKNMVNVGQKSVELIKLEGVYYLKMKIRKDVKRQTTSLTFGFSNCIFEVRVIENTLLDIIDLQQYNKSVKKSKGKESVEKNTIVCLGKGNYSYSRFNNRILKNIVRQHIEDGMLSPIFIKSPLLQCQIVCNRPFTVQSILHKEDGYWINFYYQDSKVTSEISRELIFYLRNSVSGINEMHIFDCCIKPRQVTRETISREIQVRKGQAFADLPMKMILHEKYEYDIRCVDKNKLSVVNGVSFRYENVKNEKLTLQILKKQDCLWNTELIFNDQKGRSFFMRLWIRPQQQLVM